MMRGKSRHKRWIACRAAMRCSGGDGGAAATPLLTNLVGYWNLDEASGTRNDSYINALNLTDNNTVTSGLGVDGVSTAAEFLDANSEYLSRASGWFNPANQSFSFSLWYKALDDGEEDGIYYFANTILLYRRDSNAFEVFWYPDLAAKVNAGTGTVAAGWRHLVVNVNDATKGVELFENGVSVGTGTYTNAAVAGALELGRYAGGQYCSCRMQSIGAWSRILTATEITWLYNSGAAARTYAAVAAYTG